MSYFIVYVRLAEKSVRDILDFLVNIENKKPPSKMKRAVKVRYINL
jgi:hypothetical protein